MRGTLSTYPDISRNCFEPGYCVFTFHGLERYERTGKTRYLLCNRRPLSSCAYTPVSHVDHVSGELLVPAVLVLRLSEHVGGPGGGDAARVPLGIAVHEVGGEQRLEADGEELVVRQL